MNELNESGLEAAPRSGRGADMLADTNSNQPIVNYGAFSPTEAALKDADQPVIPEHTGSINLSRSIEYQVLNMVELFSGSGTISGQFKIHGHKTFAVDIRKRKGICEPDLRADIMRMKRSDVPFDHVHFLWASPVCRSWSYGAGDFYWKDQKPKDKALPYIRMLDRTLDLIREINPDYYIIENPRARMRYNKFLQDFLSQTNGMVKYLTLGSYGFPTIKPTDLFTNIHDLPIRTPLKYGKYSKNPNVKSLDKLTPVNRQKTPQLLAEDVYNHVITKFKTKV